MGPFLVTFPFWLQSVNSTTWFLLQIPFFHVSNVSNHHFPGISQGLVTVPFWVYWTSPEKVAIIDHIPILVGWCSMGTFNDPLIPIVISAINHSYGSYKPTYLTMGHHFPGISWHFAPIPNHSLRFASASAGGVHHGGLRGLGPDGSDHRGVGEA